MITTEAWLGLFNKKSGKGGNVLDIFVSVGGCVLLGGWAMLGMNSIGGGAGSSSTSGIVTGRHDNKGRPSLKTKMPLLQMEQ
jgi:hypothetical protein